MNLILILLFAAFVVGLVMLFAWLMERWTGYSPLGTIEQGEFPFRQDMDYLKKRDFYAEESTAKREKKENPHYDALVDAEWKAANASRLEDAAPENESDEPQTLGELLEKKVKR